mgnify:CR=1 FL=1
MRDWTMDPSTDDINEIWLRPDGAALLLETGGAMLLETGAVIELQ